MGIEKKGISIRLDEDLIDRLKEVAEQENRTMSNLIETILKQHLGRLDESMEKQEKP